MSDNTKRELALMKQMYIAQKNANNTIMLLDKERANAEDRMDWDEAAKLKERGRKIEKEIESIKLRLDRIYTAMSVLDEEEKHIVLLSCCIDDMSPEDIMEMLHIEKATFYRKKKAAIEKLSRAMFGIGTDI